MNPDRYIRSGSRRVKGWLATESALLVKATSDAQIAAGTTGSVGEIGVHHGKLFILLYLLARPDERTFAVDIFEAQHLNADQSGHGDRRVFENHLLEFGADLGRVDILAKSSLELSGEELRQLAGPVRLFSIDGGHSTEIALNDLHLAEATLTRGGVAILDDAFQSLYPGVATALARYLLGVGRLVPFAVSPEKVLLTHPEYHDSLMSSIEAGMGPLYHREEEYFGHTVAIIRRAPLWNERLQLGLARTNGYQRLRDLPFLGRAVKEVRPVVLKVLKR